MPVSEGDGARSFVVRPYQPGDEGQILDLFARSFPHAPRTVEHFQWKYLKNPWGNGRISLTFDGERRLVGHYAGYPVPFRYGAEDVLAHHIGDTMTDVAVRHVGRGPTSILGRTALDFYGRFCEGQVAFNYGFNVANIQRFSLKFLRSDRVEPVTFVTRDLRAAPMAGPSLLGWWRKDPRVEAVRETGEEWDDLFDRASGTWGFGVRRDAAWVRWRYLECPDVRYRVVAARAGGRLVAWAVFRRREERLLWGDAMVDQGHESALEMILRRVVAAEEPAAIDAWFPGRPAWFGEWLRKFRFEQRPEPQDLSVMCVPFLWDDATARMRAALHYCWGDGDLF